MIKQLDDLPQQVKKMSQRDYIREDLKEAKEKGIGKFELEGECYNYNTLAATTREELQRMMDKEWGSLMKDFLQEHYKPYASEWRDWTAPKEGFCTREQFNQYCCGVDIRYKAAGTYYKVHSIKGEDRKHVYVEVDWEAPAKLYQQGLERYKKQEVQDAIRKDTQESLDHIMKYRARRAAEKQNG